MSDRECFEEDCIRHGTVDAGSCVVCQLLADAHAAGREAGMREAARIVTEHYESLSQEHRLLLVNRSAAILSAIGEPKT